MICENLQQIPLAVRTALTAGSFESGSLGEFHQELGAPVSSTLTQTNRFPVSMTEALFHRRESPRQPTNMNFDLRVSGLFDVERLRDAVVDACADHPMARVRVVSNGRRHVNDWELVDLESINWQELVRATDLTNEADLTGIRDRFFSQYLDVRNGPAFRMLVIHRPGGDSLLFGMNHSICDGAGALRFLLSVARNYADRPDELPAEDPFEIRHRINSVPLAEASDAPVQRRRGTVSTNIRRQSIGADEPCYGFHHLLLTTQEFKSLQPRRLVPEATLNDLMLAALIRTIDAWNGMPRKRDPHIVILVPFNLRSLLGLPTTEYMANLSWLGRVLADTEHLTDGEATLKAVVEQTTWLKNGGVRRDVLTAPWVRKLMVATMPLLKHWFGPAAILTNLGRFDESMDFGPAGSVTEAWISGGVGMPTGLLMGAVSLRDQLYFSFCYRRALFDAPAAAQFADLYRRNLLLLGTGSESTQTAP